MCLEAAATTSTADKPLSNTGNNASSSSSQGLHHLLHINGIQRSKSVKLASVKLKEQEDLTEVLPIQHCVSANVKVEGSYVVQEPGNYILVFDNTFSRNTPKVLSFSVALADANLFNPRLSISDDPQQQPVSGWLLKKKRKKMQGWAKRWFQLSASGVLSYSTSPASVRRGSIQILVATISINPLQRLIHIDSGTMIYHLKTLTAEDQAKWTKALRDYRTTPPAPVDECQQQQLAFLQQIQEETTTAMHENNSAMPPPPSSTAAAITKNSDSQYYQQHIKKGTKLATLLLADMTGYFRRVDEELDLVPSHGRSADNAIQGFLAESKQRILDELMQMQALWRDIEQQHTIQSKDDTDTMLPTPPFDNGVQRQDSPFDVMKRQETPFLSVPPSPANLFMYHNNTTVSSWRGSTLSEQFFDAEEILLSGEDEDEDDFRIAEEEDSDDDDDDEYDDDRTPSTDSIELMKDAYPQQCTRRLQLPAPAATDEVSAFSFIRKNVGKDLSTIAMPVSMNEPLSMLQRACEELEYSELLDKAAGFSDSLDRLLHVAVFAVSGYASSQYRMGRKPFNPMMNETYENVRPDKGFRFIAEKVCHNPLMIAAHAESQNYKLWQCVKVRSKFWGKSMEFINEGTYHVTLTGHADYITYSKPSSWLRNMIAGNKYLEHVGEMKVTNHTTGEYVIVTFKEGTGGYLFGAAKQCNEVIMHAYDPTGHKVRRVVGKWNEMLAEQVNPNQLSVLWTATPPTLKDYARHFGFTQFATELNEITAIERNKIPKTDTRYRPDQRLYEHGRVEEADAEKLRIEQKQRERRKQFEAAGVPWKPRWFKLQEDKYTDPSLIPSADGVARSWHYGGEYWLSRETGQWPSDQFDLW
ncbi:Oxysterol-binding protein-domain-containing protein [Zychaea mexicana]|uniref:Oxysterol-binding protein-domain-containing protein n=1 Tax=Zychaea mexicana TaxID=64656 RepID=UPI0022FE6075|nr:Oxysterol-binding protein-domain-containing protein [Zychaea mexicana]KAI9482535.1 Oxysterol-binding protein-domain-containing protein [Zychaea mexicana]